METRLRITYYTDPLCSWSWAMEPSWRRLRYAYGPQLEWRYKMGGLVADAATFDDPVNSVHRPAQWAPQWYEVAEKTDMPLDEKLWLENPPDSSYPACVAVKAAQRQGPDRGEHCLRRLREAAMLERRNLAEPQVLEQLVGEAAGVDADRYLADRDGPARRDFKEDLRDIRYRQFGRYPTLLLEPGNLLIVGWRPFDVLRRAVERVAPGIEPVRDAGHPVRMVEAWHSSTAPEVAAMCGLEADTARELLDEAVESGRLLRRETTATEPIYDAVDPVEYGLE